MNSTRVENKRVVKENGQERKGQAKAAKGLFSIIYV